MSSKKENIMPSFTVSSASQLSDYIVPLSEDDAVTLTEYALAQERGIYAAVYGQSNSGNYGKWLIWVEPVFIASTWHFAIVLDAYHPRSQGKAEIIVGR
jgi:hypothetical protein